MSEYIIARSELSATQRAKIDLYGGSELIRCKDCKHFTGKWCILNSRKEFDPEDRLVNGEGFCAWAERKEE